MNNYYTRLMKGSFLALCLALLSSTLSLAQIQRSVGTGKILLTTAKGTAVYEHDALSTIADFPKEGYTFYFKTHAFEGKDNAKQVDLVNVLDANNYNVISFAGKFDAPLKRPVPGQVGTARMTGTLKFQGKLLKDTHLTAKTYHRNGKFVIETTVLLDQNGNADAKKASAALGVTKPVNLTITAAY